MDFFSKIAFMRPKIILAVIVLLYLSSCKKEIINSPSLVGTWYKQKIVTQIYQDTTQISDTTVSDFTSKDYARFNSNGTGIGSASDTTNEFFTRNFNFTLSGTNLHVIQYSADGTTTVTTQYIISQLTLTSLVLFAQGTYTAPNNVIYKETQEFYFTK
jgi:hypothetical protein